MMDDFGRKHAGKPVSTADFEEHLTRTGGKSLKEHPLRGLHFGIHFQKDAAGNVSYRSEPRTCWSIHSFEKEPDRALIIYGTLKEAAAQKEAAELLQKKLLRRLANHLVPIKSDQEVSQGDLEKNHLLLIGRPHSNAIAAKCAGKLPVQFGPASFVVRGETYAHPESAVIAAGSSPFQSRLSCVLFAGLSAEGTWQCVQTLSNRGGQHAEVMLLPHHDQPRLLVVTGKEKLSPS
jgi:hypothetical protein